MGRLSHSQNTPFRIGQHPQTSTAPPDQHSPPWTRTAPLRPAHPPQNQDGPPGTSTAPHGPGRPPSDQHSPPRTSTAAHRLREAPHLSCWMASCSKEKAGLRSLRHLPGAVRPLPPPRLVTTHLHLDLTRQVTEPGKGVPCELALPTPVHRLANRGLVGLSSGPCLGGHPPLPRFTLYPPHHHPGSSVTCCPRWPLPHLPHSVTGDRAAGPPPVP